MQSQRGNFLLQSLLALTLIFAFVPFVAQRLVDQDKDAQMSSAATQTDVAATAARIYIRENANQLPYDTTRVSGNAFADLLEPYGLPLGFVPRTALGQDISLVIIKTLDSVSGYLELTGGDLSGVKRAELARRIGFYASPTDNGVIVGIALDDMYSDVVRRNETSLDAGVFLANLDMGDFSITNIGTIFARRGGFDTSQFATLSVTGVENGRKERSNVTTMTTNRAIFQSENGETALNLTRGTLAAKSVNGRTVSKFGDTGNITVGDAAVYDFAMTAGRTGFSGPEKWTVHGSVVTDKISFSTERLEISSFINAARGQDVFIDAESLEYNTKSGMDVGIIYASNITLRDQTSNALAHGGTGDVLVDIRPAGTSVLPDVLTDDVDNDAIKIIRNPAASDGATVSCRDIISDLGGRYNKNSLSQHIICQYVFWQRLEQRIDIKQCLLDGKSGCK